MHLRHRFVAKGSAVMLIGPEGDRAIFDLLAGSIIEDGSPQEARWTTFLAVFSDNAGNVPRVAVAEAVPEDVSNAPSNGADDQPPALPGDY